MAQHKNSNKSMISKNKQEKKFFINLMLKMICIFVKYDSE
jgi:hypothetical protein